MTEAPDIFWLKDKSLTDLDNLPEPNDLAEEIIENLEAGLNSFREVLTGLGSRQAADETTTVLRRSAAHTRRDRGLGATCYPRGQNDGSECGNAHLLE